MRSFLFLLCFVAYSVCFGQGYWQQHVDYTMEIDINVNNHTYIGEQKLVYTNNSPDTLHRVFYHLYFNAFKPGTDQVLASSHASFERRGVADKIAKLGPEDWGDVKVLTLKQNGKDVKYVTEETILEVDLNEPLFPGKNTLLEMSFFTKTPAVVQRSGKQNKDGVEFSMSQWYPKLCEYDKEGWHANPYIGREFHGVWGNFDVTLNIDKDYVVAASGYLQNPELIGHGYAPLDENVVHGDKISWNFIAPNVHDFSWAADPNFIHDIKKVPDGPDLHFFYEKSSPYISFWQDFQDPSVKMMEFFSDNLGKYPYDQYSIIMGGDGGMEYAMCTFIAGYEYDDYRRLLGVTSHEIAHTWFQFLMATNESKHAWMDEGFTSYIDDVCLNELLNEGKEIPNIAAYKDYIPWALSGMEEPLTTHADRYEFGEGYWISAYDKGSIFMSQLKYIVGDENFKKILKRYYHDWAFKHPDPNDFIRVCEKVTGFELDWYLMDWVQTVKTIDYAINSYVSDENSTVITLQRIGQMPMPLEVLVSLTSGDSQTYYIPLTMMRGKKPAGGMITKSSWSWAKPYYSLEVPFKKDDIKYIVIDPQGVVADVNRENNTIQVGF